EARRGRVCPGLLIVLDLERELQRIAANRNGGRRSVKRRTLKMIEHIRGRVIVSAPRGVALETNVHVHVDHRWHHGLSREGDAECPFASAERRGTDRGDMAVLDENGTVLDGRTA